MKITVFGQYLVKSVHIGPFYKEFHYFFVKSHISTCILTKILYFHCFLIVFVNYLLIIE